MTTNQPTTDAALIAKAREFARHAQHNTSSTGMLLNELADALSPHAEKPDPRPNTSWMDYEGAMADLSALLDAVILRLNGQAPMETLAEFVRLNYPRRASEIHAEKPKGVEGDLTLWQEPKYRFSAEGVFNRASGEMIPHDEPIMLFRARDKHAVRLIGCYLAMVADIDHQDAVEARLTQFEDFSGDHAERMKEPDTAPTDNPRMKMLVDADWLRRQVETDPDLDADIVPNPPKPAPTEEMDDALRALYARAYADGYVDKAYPEGSADDGEDVRNTIDPMAIIEGFEQAKEDLAILARIQAALAEEITEPDNGALSRYWQTASRMKTATEAARYIWRKFAAASPTPILVQYETPPRVEFVISDEPTVSVLTEDIRVERLVSMDRTRLVGVCVHLAASPPSTEEG